MGRDRNYAADVLNILLIGRPTDIEAISDDSAGMVIDILKEMSIKDPQLVLRHIRDAVECRLDRMVPLALAILTTSADEMFFNRENIGTIQSILTVYDPPELLEYIEWLKSKAFGKGFGSRPQKWVRATVESWSPKYIDTYAERHPLALRSLVRLVHPRLRGTRGERIRAFLANNGK